MADGNMIGDLLAAFAIHILMLAAQVQGSIDELFLDQIGYAIPKTHGIYPVR